MIEKDTVRINVSFTEEQAALVDSCKGIFGASRSEVVKTAFLAYMSDKGYLDLKRGLHD